MAEQIAASIVIERTYRASVEELWALWTSKDGFEAWWGPEGFRADVHLIEANLGGILHYEMVADSAEMITAMQSMGQPLSTTCRGSFAAFRPHEHLALRQMIDFLPGIEAYESLIEVDFITEAEGRVRMIVTLHQMHDLMTTQMQEAGFRSQLSKLDKRYLS